MERERAVGNKAQHLEAEMTNAERDLVKIHEGYPEEIFTAEEARSRSMEARERKERDR